MSGMKLRVAADDIERSPMHCNVMCGYKRRNYGRFSFLHRRIILG
ncbi:MAG: hypothetical protein ACR2OE_11185 [Thermomicrobiales bacterium]